MLLSSSNIYFIPYEISEQLNPDPYDALETIGINNFGINGTETETVTAIGINAGPIF